MGFFLIYTNLHSILELATTPDEVKAKKSELRLYCDLLMQQVHSIKEAALTDPQPDVTVGI